MMDFPEPSIPPGWTTEIDNKDIHETDQVEVTVRHRESNAYADIVDISSEDEISVFVVRATPDLTEATVYTVLDSVLGPSEAIEIIEQFMAQVDIAVEDGEEIQWAIRTILHEYAPKNDDPATGHPAEVLLEGHPIAIGPNPIGHCFVSGRLIHDSLIHTPRVFCYAVGENQDGWAPIAFFHESTNITSVAKARQVFPEDFSSGAKDEVVLSGLAIALDFKDASVNNERNFQDRTIKRLEFHDLAVCDQS